MGAAILFVYIWSTSHAFVLCGHIDKRGKFMEDQVFGFQLKIKILNPLLKIYILHQNVQETLEQYSKIKLYQSKVIYRKYTRQSVKVC